MSIFELAMEIKPEKTKQSNIEQSEPSFHSTGIDGYLEAINQTSSTPTLLERYITGWRMHDQEAIIATLIPNCIITESFVGLLQEI